MVQDLEIICLIDNAYGETEYYRQAHKKSLSPEYRETGISVFNLL